MLPPYLDMHRKFWKQITHWPLLPVSRKRQGCYSLPLLGQSGHMSPNHVSGGYKTLIVLFHPRRQEVVPAHPNPWPESCSEGRRELVEIYHWKYWSSSGTLSAGIPYGDGCWGRGQEAVEKNTEEHGFESLADLTSSSSPASYCLCEPNKCT